MTNDEILNSVLNPPKPKEKPKRKGSRWEKGHEGYYKGKKIDTDLFIQAADLYLSGQKNQLDASKVCGLSYVTFAKRMRMLFEDGRLSGDFFLDGQPVIIDLNADGKPSNGDILDYLEGDNGR